MVRVVYQLRRGSLGLGIDVNGRNEVVSLIPNGQAAVDGLGLVGDVVEAVDGQLLQGHRLQDAMVPGQRAYELIVQRSSVPLEDAVSRSFSPVPLLRCLELRIRRGTNGLGIDIGNVSSVRGLIPGGMAEQEGVLLPGDLITAVDGVMVGLAGLKPLIAPGRSSYRLMVLRPDVPAPQTTAVVDAEQQQRELDRTAAIEQLAIVGEEATSRARAAIAEAERAQDVSRAATAAASIFRVPPEGSNPFSPETEDKAPTSAQIGPESAAGASETTAADAVDAEGAGAGGALEATVADASISIAPSFSLVIEQASAAKLEAQKASQRLGAGSRDSRATAEAAYAVTATAQSLAARPRALSTAELMFLQQDRFVDSDSVESERRLAIERAVQLEKLAVHLAATKQEKLANAAEAATAEREVAEPSPNVMQHGDETERGDTAKRRNLTTPTPTTDNSQVWGVRSFLWGTNAVTPAAGLEQPAQQGIAVKSISAAHNPVSKGEGENSKGACGGAYKGQDDAEPGGGRLGPVVPTKTSEQRSSAQLAVLWDIETCPLPSEAHRDSGTGAAVAGAMESVSRRWEDIAGWRARIGPVIVYGSTGDVHAATRDLAYGSTVKLEADSSDRVGAMLTDLLVNALDHPSTAVLLITNQRSVLTAAIQLAVRGFGVSVALPDGFDPDWLPSSERIALLRGLYCWPQLLPYTRKAAVDAKATAGRKGKHQDAPADCREELPLAELAQEATISSNDAQAAAPATATLSVPTSMVSTASSRCHGGANESAPLAAELATDAEAVGSDDPLVKMIRQAQSLGDDALVASLQAIIA